MRWERDSEGVTGSTRLFVPRIFYAKAGADRGHATTRCSTPRPDGAEDREKVTSDPAHFG